MYVCYHEGRVNPKVEVQDSQPHIFVLITNHNYVMWKGTKPSYLYLLLIAPCRAFHHARMSIIGEVSLPSLLKGDRSLSPKLASAKGQQAALPVAPPSARVHLCRWLPRRSQMLHHAPN